MVWLVYPLTTIVPNYSAFRKRNRRLLTVSFYDRRDDDWQLLRSWQLFGHMYTRPKALTAEQPSRRTSAWHLHNRILTATRLSPWFQRVNNLDCRRASRRRKAFRCARRWKANGIFGTRVCDSIRQSAQRTAERVK